MDNMETERNEDGTFKAGHSGFKSKGSINEIQKVTREKLGEFLASKIDELPAIYEKLSDKEKAKLIMWVCELFLPKQKEIAFEMAENFTPIITTMIDGKIIDGTLK
jgi:hypothetical protein